MEEFKIPEIPGIPLADVEGLQGELRRRCNRLAGNSALLNPDESRTLLGVFVDQGALDGLRKDVDNLSGEVQDAWEGWLRWRQAQVLNRPAETKPNDLFLDKIVQVAARLAVRTAEMEKMSELVDRQVARQKAITEPPRARLGVCKLKNGMIAFCDGREIVYVDGDDQGAAYFSDTGQALDKYLKEVRAEKKANAEWLREEKRQAYHTALLKKGFLS